MFLMGTNAASQMWQLVDQVTTLCIPPSSNPRFTQPLHSVLLNHAHMHCGRVSAVGRRTGKCVLVVLAQWNQCKGAGPRHLLSVLFHMLQ